MGITFIIVGGFVIVGLAICHVVTTQISAERAGKLALKEKEFEIREQMRSPR